MGKNDLVARRADSDGRIRSRVSISMTKLSSVSPGHQRGNCGRRGPPLLCATEGRSSVHDAFHPRSEFVTESSVGGGGGGCGPIARDYLGRNASSSARTGSRMIVRSKETSRAVLAIPGVP